VAGSSRYTVVLDACVLFPAPVRDLLLSLAHQGLYHARWTETITDEWIRGVLRNRPDLEESRLRQTAQTMAGAIPDSQISGYARFVDVVELPDPNDRHVIAAAIAGHADAIVTFNLKDFPATSLEPLGIEIQHPDDFVVNQLHLNLTDALKAVKALRMRLIRPPQNPADIIKTITRCGLPQTASLLADNSELI